MPDRRLIGFGAAAGAFGGALRIASSFIPAAPDSPGLEALYAAIDLGMLFGLIGAYLAAGEAIGALGFAGFVVALSGLASIVGPDATMFGVDFYRLGAAIFLAGLALFSASLLRARLLRFSAGLWLAAFAAGVAAAITTDTMAFAAAGVLLGTGYAMLGRALLQRAPLGDQSALISITKR